MNRRLRGRAAAPPTSAAAPVRTAAAGGAARRPPTRLRERLSAWRDLHAYSLFSSLGRLLARPWASALTIGVMGVALSLPLGLWLALQQLAGLAGEVREARELSVFLQPALDADAVADVATRLRAREDIEAVRVRSPEEGLAEFRSMTEFAGALAVLDYNPLPAVLVVSPAATADPAALAAVLEREPATDFVQHDALWRERLAAWLAFGERLAWVVAGLLGLGALLVVGNTVRLDIQGRAEEIAIVQLLGATDGFVRRPFLYLGAWYGLAAGLLAWLLVALATWSLRAPLLALAGSHGEPLPALALPWQSLPPCLLAGLLLGWLGARIASGHQLRRARALA